MLALNYSQSCVKFNINTIAEVYIISLLNHCTKKRIKKEFRTFYMN